MTRGIAWTIVLSAVVASQSLAADRLQWPQFRGPDGSGVAEGQKPPVEIGLDKNVKWKVAVPSGYSSPIVVGDKLVMTAFDSDKLYTIAYNRADGSEAWRADAKATKIEPYMKTESSPAASTPATDGQRIVSYFGSCGLICYDLDGNELWRYELPTAATIADFGTGNSPVLADGSVILLREEIHDPKLIVVDLSTGKLKWEKKRESRTSFSTPVVWDTPQGKQIVVPGTGRLIAYDLATGDERWTFSGMPSTCCTTPVTADGNLFFAGWSPGGADDTEFKMPAYDSLLEGDADKDGKISLEESEKTFLKGFFAGNDTNKDGFVTREEWEAVLKTMASSVNSVFSLSPGGSGDISKSNTIWRKTKGMPYVSSAILYGGQYMMVKDGGLVTAYDAKTGNDVYVQQRAADSGKYYASPVAANGNIYLSSLDNGVVTVLKAGTDKPEVVASNPAFGERIAATPAIADDTLYLRTAGHLYAFAQK